MKRIAFLPALLWSAVAMAQQPNTVTATVSTTLAAAAGTASFQVQFLDANLNSTVETALGVVGSAGAAVSNLTNVSVAVSQGFVVTTYLFTVNVPAADFAATRDRLIAAQRAIANVTTQAVGWTTSYLFTDEENARLLDQAMPNLLTLARTQAATLATAMGGKPGKVSSIATPAVARSGLSATVTAAVTFVVE